MFLRIYHSLFLLAHSINVHYIFCAKKTLGDPTDLAYPKSSLRDLIQKDEEFSFFI